MIAFRDWSKESRMDVRISVCASGASSHAVASQQDTQAGAVLTTTSVYLRPFCSIALF